jgi:hypothetical protein
MNRRDTFNSNYLAISDVQQKNTLYGPPSIQLTCQAAKHSQATQTSPPAQMGSCRLQKGWHVLQPQHSSLPQAKALQLVVSISIAPVEIGLAKKKRGTEMTSNPNVS